MTPPPTALPPRSTWVGGGGVSEPSLLPAQMMAEGKKWSEAACSSPGSQLASWACTSRNTEWVVGLVAVGRRDVRACEGGVGGARAPGGLGDVRGCGAGGIPCSVCDTLRNKKKMFIRARFSTESVASRRARPSQSENRRRRAKNQQASNRIRAHADRRAQESPCTRGGRPGRQARRLPHRGVVWRRRHACRVRWPRQRPCGSPVVGTQGAGVIKGPNAARDPRCGVGVARTTDARVSPARRGRRPSPPRPHSSRTCDLEARWKPACA